MLPWVRWKGRLHGHVTYQNRYFQDYVGMAPEEFSNSMPISEPTNSPAQGRSPRAGCATALGEHSMLSVRTPWYFPHGSREQAVTFRTGWARINLWIRQNTSSSRLMLSAMESLRLPRTPQANMGRNSPLNVTVTVYNQFGVPDTASVRFETCFDLPPTIRKCGE
jgi:hypothetical protein